MRPVPLLAFFFLSLTLLSITDPGRAEAAPPDKATSEKKSSSKADKPSSDRATSDKSSSDKASSEKASSSSPDAVDPWEGSGAPPAATAGASAAGSTATPGPPPPPPPEEAPVDPRTAYHKGNAAFREGRFTAARHYYRRALEGDSSFDVLCNLGRAEAELKDNVPAWVHLSQCLELYPKDPELSATRNSFSTLREDVQDRLTSEQYARAQEMLAEAKAAPTHAGPAAATAASSPTDESAPEVDLGPRSPGLRLAVTFGLGGLALVGLGGGIGFSVHSADLGAQADALRAEIEDTPGGNCTQSPHPNCQALSETLARSDDAQHIALGSFIAAGALATSAVLTYVLWPHDHGPAKSAIGPGGKAVRTFADLRPTGAFDPARGSMWLGLRGRF